MPNEERGILTIAYGTPKYLRMGRALARSVRHHNDDEQLAVVTDTPDYFEGLYDHLIPVDLSFGSGVTQKLHLDRYTPFDETLFVDSDCLLYGPTERLWDYFAVSEGVGVRSVRELTYGDACQGVRDLDRYLNYFDLESIPNLKGGFYYFDNSKLTTDIFDSARRIYDVRDEAGLTAFKNAAVADEVVMGTALTLCDVEALSYEEAPVNTFLGRIKPVDINVLVGTSRYVKNGTPVEPTAIHYGLGTQDGYCYLRDVRRLEQKGDPLAEGRARLGAAAESAGHWGREKWRNVRNRVQEMGTIGVLPGRVLRRMGLMESSG